MPTPLVEDLAGVAQRHLLHRLGGDEVDDVELTARVGEELRETCAW